MNPQDFYQRSDNYNLDPTQYNNPGLHNFNYFFITQFLDEIARITYGNVPPDYRANLGLNCRYGVELEFCHIEFTAREVSPQPADVTRLVNYSNRYILANKVNNCIYNQNSNEFKIFNLNPSNNAQTILAQQQQQQQVALTSAISNNVDDFNEWTNFMLEVGNLYHANTHNGVPTAFIDRRGNSGVKIENDCGVGPRDWFGGNYHAQLGIPVDFHNDQIALWYAGNPNNNVITSLFNNSQDIENEDCLMTIMNINTLRDIIGTPRGPGNARLQGNNLSMRDKIIGYTELVTPILVNDPFIITRYGRQYALPYGYLLLDNMINHMKNHNTVILTQNEGLHIHISKNTRTPAQFLNGSQVITARDAVSFAKLFYVFEPLFAACQPTYRSDGVVPGYQSLQSMFTFAEMLNLSTVDIYNTLTSQQNSFHYPAGRGQNRRVRNNDQHEARYLSVNFSNTLPGEIGTIEFRMGNSTFDSKAVQLCIHMLQIIFQMSQYCIALAVLSGRNEYYYVNKIMEGARIGGCIPAYCFFTSAQYDRIAPNRLNGILSPGNIGRPLHGFFWSHSKNPTGRNLRTDIISNLCKLYFGLSYDRIGIKYAIKYINLYHMNGNTTTTGTQIPTGYPKFFDNFLNRININSYITDYSNAFQMHTKEILFQFVIMYSVPGNIPDDVFYYLANDNIPNLDNRCKTCSYSHQTNRCSTVFNNGNPVIDSRGQILNFAGPSGVRRNIADNRDVSHVFFDSSTWRNTYPPFQNQKVQTELLNNKITDGAFTGGKSKTKKSKTKKNKTKIKKKLKSFSSNTKKNNKKNRMSINTKEYRGGELDKISMDIENNTDELNSGYKLYYVPLNKGLFYCSIFKDESGKIRVYYVKENENMTELANELINKNILNYDELYSLAFFGYFEPSIYLDENNSEEQILGEINNLQLIKDGNFIEKILPGDKIQTIESIVIDKNKLTQIKNIFTKFLKK